MATRYKAKCAVCIEEFVLTKGGGMSWCQKVCNCCGSCIDVPRKAPEGVANTMSKEAIHKYLANRVAWSRRGGHFEPGELAILQELTEKCVCGGHLELASANTVYRCPKCKSDTIQIDDFGILFD